MRLRALVAAVLTTASLSFGAFASPLPEISEHFLCDAPVADVHPGPEADAHRRYLQRDMNNQACAHQRMEDQFRNDELRDRYLTDGPGAYMEQVKAQASEPTRPRATAAQWLPGAAMGDPFRDPQVWAQQGRGRFIPIRFVSTTGARLAGEIWLPPSSIAGPYPGLIVATGSSQQYRQAYHWVAQGMAEEGYMVMTFDFQGQGGSENLTHNSDGSFCSNQRCIRDDVPADVYDPDGHIFYAGMKDAIAFFFSSSSSPYSPGAGNFAGSDRFNPASGSLDQARVGLAGHSVGGVVATDLGQEDQRIKAIARWGYTGFIRADIVSKAHAPVLTIDSDYGTKGPQPYLFQPSPINREFGYFQMRSLGLETMHVTLRASTHYEWTWVPGRPASRYGERVSFYYTLAWFDAYLKGLSDPAVATDGMARLIAKTFDDSADARSIGTGTYVPEMGSGGFVNRPYTIEGHGVPNRLSYQYRSMYWMRGGAYACEDLWAGC